MEKKNYAFSLVLILIIIIIAVMGIIGLKLFSSGFGSEKAAESTPQTVNSPFATPSPDTKTPEPSVIPEELNEKDKQQEDEQIEEALEEQEGQPEPAVFETPPFLAVPILTYHHFTDNPAYAGSITKEIARFREDMAALKEAGFTTLSFSDLFDYVDGVGIDLPEKPIIITFDDGYLSNYTLAYPILKELDMKATVFVIGWSIGRSTRLDGVTKIIPHFSVTQALEMEQSGLIDIQSHTFNFHERTADGFDRNGVLKKSGETLEQYFEAFKADDDELNKIFTEHFGERSDVFCYPYWLGDSSSEQIVRELGYKSSLLYDGGVSVIVKGEPQSLFALSRINITNEMSATDMLYTIDTLTKKALNAF